MVKALIFIIMEIYILANLNMIINMVKVNFNICYQTLIMKEIGIREKDKDMVNRFFKMVIFMKDIGKMEHKMV